MAGYPPPPLVPYPSFVDYDRNTTYMVVPVQNGMVQSPQAPAQFSDWSNMQAQQLLAQQILAYQQAMENMSQAPGQQHVQDLPMDAQQMAPMMPFQSFHPISAMPSVPMTPSKHNAIHGYPMATPQVATPSSAMGRLNIGRQMQDGLQASTPSHSRKQPVDQTPYRVSKHTSPKKSTVKKDHGKKTSPTKRSPEKKKSVSSAKKAAAHQATLPSPPNTAHGMPLDSFDSASFPQLAPLNPSTTMAPNMSRDPSGQSTYYSPLGGLDNSPEATFEVSPESSHFDEAFAAISNGTTPEENVLETPPMSFEPSPENGLLEDPFTTRSPISTPFESKLVAVLTRAMAGHPEPKSPVPSPITIADFPIPPSITDADATNPTATINTTTTSSSSSSANASPDKTAASGEVDPAASMVETGITAADIEAYIQNPADTVNGRWRCLFPECPRDFGRKENCRSHVQTHLGDRPYQCPDCHKCFVRQHDLKRHANTHSGEKQYQCPCGRNFVRQDALTRHRQRGMCCGALEGAVRKEGKRGRPRKVRPEEGEENTGMAQQQAHHLHQPQPQPQPQPQYQYQRQGVEAPMMTAAATAMGSGSGRSDFVLFPSASMQPAMDAYIQWN